jgi:hypothetical protein
VQYRDGTIVSMKTEVQKKLKSMGELEIENLAQKLDSSAAYLTSHIYYRRKIPRRDFMSVLQSELQLSGGDMYDHFYNV